MELDIKESPMKRTPKPTAISAFWFNFCLFEKVTINAPMAKISGAKNAVLPILAASVITKGENIFELCPEISDVDSMLKILSALGCSVEKDGDKIKVDATGISRWKIPDELMKEMRSSVFLAGSLLSRFGEAVISNPGGCNIGKRPIDIHINGLKQMGAEIERTVDSIIIKADRLKPAKIKLEYPSVGATENLLLAAVSAKGKTIIENSAREPEIIDLQDYINKCGGCVSGAGTGRIEVYGGKSLRGCIYKIMPDRIEAGTYALMAAAAGGKVKLQGAQGKYLESFINILKQGGLNLNCTENDITLESEGNEVISADISTAPYPGFPTDLQPQIVSMLCKNGKSCVIEENIFENRFEYLKQLIKMGADVEISGKQVIIKNNNILYGTSVEAKDLRGGAALLIAGLSAQGITHIYNTKYIKRGYSRLEDKLGLIGGEITEYEEEQSYRKKY